MDTAACGFACNASETPEIFINNVDDKADGLVDCHDSDCNIAGSLSLSDAQLNAFNCLGCNVVSETDLNSLGLDYYCGKTEGREDIGSCCPAGRIPQCDTIPGTSDLG